MTNFLFLQKDFPDLYELCREAEEYTNRIPQYALLKMRVSLEGFVQWMYTNDSLEMPYDTSLSAMMHQYGFRNLVGERIFKEINLLRLYGNDAAHQPRIAIEKAQDGIQYLHSFACLFHRFYGSEKIPFTPFDGSFIPTHEQEKAKAKELERLRKEAEERNESFRKEQEELKRQLQESEAFRQQLEQERLTIAQHKEARINESDFWPSIPVNIDERTTRKQYIDVFLAEAGWDQLIKGYNTEYKVTNLKSSTSKSGVGYVDYVLWGDDGLPLAVIEAKKTLVDATKGRQQALQYADSLEEEHKQRPIIFYSNGYETFIWDDLFYVPRAISGFLTKESLQLLVDRRRRRTDLRLYKVNTEIAGRPYQMEAVRRIAEHFVSDIKVKMENVSAAPMTFRGKNRRSLLVMATGSGKTRTSAAVIDMLTKCNWAKRVLFLADRTALVSQAKKNIAEYLPNLACEDISGSKESSEARVVFSTYHTMMHRIDAERENGKLHYTVGHFDAIIIDEAHRSVYQSFGQIFDYFDALLIGLTATPKKDIHINTYQLFQLEDENPTFAYQLDEAVRDKYLVPPKAASVPLKFVREGIKYKELSKREQEEYENKFGVPTVGVNDEIGSEALNRWLMNNDTIDQVLNYLMTNGIKVNGGDKLGKTIIFAKSHHHAIHIQERFNSLYPEYGGHFLRVIDNQESRALDLLEQFVEDRKELSPQIAVSVDMMDTGVDAPRVVNLVFFKPVKSFSKFWQMIGRGTRLRPNLFGPGEDKTHFLIFDFCENFEFFDEFPEGMKTVHTKKLSQRVFEAKLDVAVLITENGNGSTEELHLAQKYKHGLYEEVIALDKLRFEVRKHLRQVEQFSNWQQWEDLNETAIKAIKGHLSFLPPVIDSDELAKRFDNIVLQLMQFKLKNHKRYSDSVAVVRDIAQRLAKKSNIPQVKAQMDVLSAVLDDQFWVAVTLGQLEEVREKLRDLMFALEKEAQEIVYTNFKDDLSAEGVVWKEPVGTTSFSLESYQKRMQSYVLSHKDHLVIQKLYQNEPITMDELNKLEELLFNNDLGSREEYEKAYGTNQPLGKFIRSIVGMDIQAANKAFAHFLNKGNLASHQQKFIQTIIDFLNKNGVLEKSLLFEKPFTYMHEQGPIGLFPEEDVHEIISIVQGINDNAGVA